MKNPRELLASGAAGAAATGCDLGLLLFLVGPHARVPVPAATFGAAVAGAAVGFVANKYVAFRDRSPLQLDQLARFQVVALVAALLMAGAMKIVAVGLGVPIVPAKLACATLVFLLWTYPAQRRFVFGRARGAGSFAVAGDPPLAARDLPSPRLQLSRGG